MSIKPKEEVTVKSLIEKPVDEPLAVADGPRLGVVENLESSDYEVPRCHLFQGTPWEQENYGEFSRGTWIDTSTKTEITDLRFMLLKGFKDYREFDEDGKMINRSTNRDDFESPPEDQLNFLILLADDWKPTDNGVKAMPKAWRCRKSSYKIGKRMNTLAATHDGRTVYELGSRPVSGQNGPYYVPTVEPVGVADDETYRFACQKLAQVGGRKIVTDEDRDDDIPF